MEQLGLFCQRWTRRTGSYRPAGEVLAGVGVFSVSMNQQVIPAYFGGFAPSEGIELGRFVLADSLAANAASYCLARMHPSRAASGAQRLGVLRSCRAPRRNRLGRQARSRRHHLQGHERHLPWRLEPEDALAIARRREPHS